VNSTRKKTCFVISPIGGEGTDVRQGADDFLELLVTPALEKYAFEVIRGDRIANSSMITSDIVRLVQESDLCIIDLTGNNPNVFYECGRRHETGRPFIQMVSRSSQTSLPFDVSGIRTVAYDLSSPRAVRESQQKLQEFIDALVESGFEAGSSGESLSSLAQAIERIERKVSALLSSPQATTHSREREADDEDIDIKDIVAGPQEGFLRAFKRGDMDRALAQLSRLKKAVSPVEYLSALALVVSVGNERAFELMDEIKESILKRPADFVDRDKMMTTIGQALQSCFTNTGDLERGIQFIETLCNRLLADDSFERKTKAFIANKVGMVAWAADQYEKCIQFTKLALDLHDEPAYAYNLSLVYDHLNRDAERDTALKRLASMSNLDPDHVRMLRKHGLQPGK